MGNPAEMPLPDRLVPPPGFLAAAGELGALIAAFDWSATPLGPLDAPAPTSSRCPATASRKTARAPSARASVRTSSSRPRRRS